MELCRSAMAASALMLPIAERFDIPDPLSSLSVPLRERTPLLRKGCPLPSLPTPFPIRYAAVCKAVAAAARRAAWALALASFCAQSGLILSVVMTLGAEADSDVVRRRVALVGESIVLSVEFMDEEEDMAEVALASGWV